MSSRDGGGDVCDAGVGVDVYDETIEGIGEGTVTFSGKIAWDQIGTDDWSELSAFRAELH